MPWRGASDPYHTWVSEIMLQQTQVATVIPYYERFLAAFPTVHDLAAAHLDEVLGLWEGLGYYSRARNLHLAAQEIVFAHGGRFPAEPKAARALPGIGEYTAGAILSIAYGVRLPALDGNAFRVLARVFGLRGSVSAGATRQRLQKLGAEAVPADRPGDYNQALMEQGSQVCTPRQPRCAECCLAELCVAQARGLVDVIPEVDRAASRPVREAAALVMRQGKLLLAKRPAKGVWGGLWQLPQVALKKEAAAETLGEYLATAFSLRARSLVQFTTARYGIMDQRVELTVYLCEQPAGRATSSSHEAVAWVPLGTLDNYALPAPHRRLVKKLREHLGGGRLPL